VADYVNYVGPDKARIMIDGSAALGRLRYRIAGLIAEHDDWQWVNAQLDAAVGKPFEKSAFRIPNWSLVVRKLTDLLESHPMEPWSGVLKNALDIFSLEEPVAGTMDNRMRSNRAFDGLRRACVQRFVEVDDELNDLCSEIAKFELPLEELLQ
jgi:hypothetical protein